jgi:hypothetical protein
MGLYNIKANGTREVQFTKQYNYDKYCAVFVLLVVHVA